MLEKLKDEDLADGLYHIAKVADHVLSGGYDYGCGVDYSNDVFTMYGYWGHAECDICEDRAYEAADKALEECGVDLDEWKEAWEVHYSRDDDWDSRPQYPSNYREVYDRIISELEEENPHECNYREWGFEHPSSGLKVKWYKRIGRSTESNISMGTLAWYRVVVECLESLKEEWDARATAER